jgi:uncharacterized membrane protein YphA (DoxX/SURF4 family)
MSHLPIPLAVVYAGLGGTLLALCVATATNKWSLRVFVLLALRLAIGWHFLFEGLYKVQSHNTGPTETNRPFSSEMYFKVAPGPIGAYMRNQFSDPAKEIAEKLTPPEALSADAFAKLKDPQQAEKCPAAVAAKFDALTEAAVKTYRTAAENELKAATTAEEKAVKDATATEEKATKEAKTDEDKAKAKATADAARTKAKADGAAARAAAQKKIDTADAGGKELVTYAKAAFARWVYGADKRDCKVKGVTGDVPLSARDRVEYVEWAKGVAKAAEERRGPSLGTGTGTDNKRVSEFRMDAVTAESDLARDANAFIAELQKELNGGKDVVEEVAPSRGQMMDKFTMWFLVGAGACLMFGLFTRVACLAAAGFLVMTYLAHPAFPWYPLPPNTEGNPVFVNKNVIECLALIALALYPTGRWLGLDALVLRPFCKYECDKPAAAT